MIKILYLFRNKSNKIPNNDNNNDRNNNNNNIMSQKNKIIC